MKSVLLSVIGILSFALMPPVIAQEKTGAIAAAAVESIVTVVDIDREKRIVIVRGPQGREVSINVPPEAQNLDQVQPGSRFKVVYLESVAVSIRKGGAASSSAGRTVKLAPKGDVPGGMVVNMLQIAGVVESIDYGSRLVSVRGPEGKLLSIVAGDDVENLEQIKTGDVISLEYTESLAMRMIRE